jgi:hypothetical protein
MDSCFALQMEGRRIPHGNSLAETPQQAFLSFICKAKQLCVYNSSPATAVKHLLIFS